jgi:hypothetical protein
MAINKARFVAFGTTIFPSRVQHGGRGPASARIRFIHRHGPRFDPSPSDTSWKSVFHNYAASPCDV